VTGSTESASKDFEVVGATDVLELYAGGASGADEVYAGGTSCAVELPEAVVAVSIASTVLDFALELGSGITGSVEVVLVQVTIADMTMVEISKSRRES